MRIQDALLEAQKELVRLGKAWGKNFGYQAKPIVRLMGEVEVSKLTPVGLQAYRVRRLDGEGAKESTLNNELACLNSAFRMARLLGEAVPELQVKRSRPQNARQGFLTRERFAAFLEAVRAESPGSVEVTEYLWLTGRRLGEALKLCWEHILWGEARIVVPPRLVKNRRAQTIPLRGRLLDLLWGIQPQNEQSATGTVFRTSVGGFRRAFRAAAAACGEAELLPHDLRRSFVRNCLRAGISRRVAMRLVGHSSMAMLERYDIWDPADEEDLFEAAKLLDVYLLAS